MGYKHDEFSISSFITRGSLYIPDYQRDYSWTDAELSDFWDDLIQLKKDRETNLDSTKKHFFGMIVIHDDQVARKKFIIDGQQRITTSFIFLSALRRAFMNVDPDIVPPNVLKDLNSYTIWLSYLTDGRSSSRLILGKNDNDFFVQNIIAQLPSEPIKKGSKKSSNNRIRNAYNYFVEKIDERRDTARSSHSNWYEELDSLFHSFTEGFMVISLETSDLAEAYTIFETLNARGKELAASDLLKNYLLKTINETKSHETLDKWNVMSQKLDDDLPTYIRYYWNAHKSFIRKKDLYKAIVSEYTDSYHCRSFFDDLIKYCDLYVELSTGKCEDIITDKSLIKHISDLKLLGASTFHPIIIALFRASYLQSDIARVAHAILVYFVRNIKVYGKTANSTETFFSQIAYEIYRKKLEVAEIVDEIKEKTIDDQSFQNAMKELTTKDKNLIRYIFRELHVFASPSGQELNLDNDKVHIEHIMPQDASLWNVETIVHEKYLWRIGNLTLLSQTLNQSIKKKLFVDKVNEAYRISDIIPTRALCDYSRWGKDEIEARQNRIAADSVNIWKI